MKIEGNNPGSAAPLTPTDAASLQKHREDEKTARTGDRVELSPEAALALEAQKASQQEPDIRQDVVDRARALLANDEVGNDTTRLAEHIIRSLLE
jgi:anti-sigma28 factor (negative regulator of flagellin synthesis)